VSIIFYFNPEFAKKYGLHEAIVFEVINKLNNFTNNKFYLNKHWVELTGYTYNIDLYFIPENEVDYAIANLVKRNVLEELYIDDRYYYTILKRD
jgi:hypothetical protein